MMRKIISVSCKETIRAKRPLQVRHTMPVHIHSCTTEVRENP
jgi:hypothetical protein